MVTLLIVSLLAIVAVSFLTSMGSERQTADAYMSKSQSEQAAQAGVEAAEAILAQSFRDYPDSCTVWDTNQTYNTGSPNTQETATTVAGATNEGTSLYFHAVANGGVPNPEYTGTNSASNDPGGNNPNNPACKTFVLPLISGVLNGNAQLASSTTHLTTDLTEVDPSKQTNPKLTYCTDLNVRRFSGDMQGAIGSPPDWVATSPHGPKPARANWVNLAGIDGRVTGRYAFWMEDESFRLNSSAADNVSGGPNTQAFDNAANGMRPKDGNGNYRSMQPSDLMLLGSLNKINDTSASADATSVLATRASYPDSFFPDPLAFVHSITDGKSSFSTSTLDALRYLTTNQSGALNLTRHGTQRYNLNSLVTATDPNDVASKDVAQTQINRIVQTLKFHLPYFGQRFYRTSNATSSSVLNNASQVPGSPVSAGLSSNHSNIYYYKVAANILDYIDPDSQPTMIDTSGLVMARTTPTGALNGNSYGGASEIWAQGKEAGPYLQEAAVRLRPVVFTTGKPMPYNYELKIDYYLEFWNMTDRDIYAAKQTDNPLLPNLGGATVRVSSQQNWVSYPSGGLLTCNGNNNTALSYRDSSTDYIIDLVGSVYQNGALQKNGVVFKAGTCTVITTDPDYASYTFKGPPGAVSMPATSYPSVNLANTYYCASIGTTSQRDYTGTIKSPDYGLQTVFRDPTTGNSKEDDELEVTLGNSNGYIDSVACAISEHGLQQWTGTDKTVGTPGSYNDYSYSSCRFGNVTDGNLYYPAIASEMGDPRTNNEQMSITLPYAASYAGDQTRFVYGSAADTTLGYPNAASQQPATGNYTWPDYYIFPAALGGVVPNPDASNAPMVIADKPLTSIGQLGDVFDPARLPGPAGIAYSRGGGRTFKIGQHDDRYSSDPSGNTNSNTADNIPASNGWAAWRLADVFDVADPIELPARININGVQRDKGAALLALFQGFVFQPATSAGSTTPSTDQIVHGDGHTTPSLANQPLAGPNDTNGSTSGFSQLVQQITTRLQRTTPGSDPSGPFFERGELGELGTGTSFLFGVNAASAFASANKGLVSTVDMNKTFDHGREELVRRIAQMICTRGDTFTIYATGQSILQASSTAPMKVTGTHRMRLTFRLVPKNPGGDDFHPGYNVNTTTGAITQNLSYTDLSDTSQKGRFTKPDHYAIQVLQTATY